MKERNIAVFMWITAVCVASNIYLLIPIYSAVADGLSISYDEAVFSSTIFIFCYAIGLLSFGPISEKFSKKHVLFLGMIISALLTFSLGLSFSQSSFYIFRALQGLALGSFAPVAYAYCFDSFTPKIRTFIIAIINTGFLMAGIIGQLLSSSFLLIFNWRAVFYFLGLMYLILSFFTFYILPKTSSKNLVSEKVNSTSKLVQPSIIVGLFLTFFTLMSFVSFYEELAQYFIGQEKVLFYTRCIGLLGTPLSLFSGKWLKKHPPLKIILVCLSFMIGAFAFMLLTKQLFLITCLSIIFVSSIAVLIPSLITFIGESAADKRATAISLYSFTLLTGASVGPMVSSFLDFQHTLFLFISIFCIGFISFFFLRRC
ncbi:MFS transporter [Metabacillus litoralis]|uniref:MFS transporter n=1 Tax=Metabacillus litoralis TaxID=152268 RepID=UPI001CFE78EE|nr:MFS transporter [Metabacillus litoralis]